MGPIAFNEEQIASFVMVLTRVSILFALVPFIGDRVVPVPLKVLLSLIFTIVLFPIVRPQFSEFERSGFLGAGVPAWFSAITTEVLVGLVLGFVSRLGFECIQFGAGIVGNMMGFASATIYDPNFESQVEVVGHFQVILATLLFVTLDGHHVMIRSIAKSYELLPIGSMVLSNQFANSLIGFGTQFFQLAVQLAAPIGICLFLINVIYAILSKSMPQMNVLVLSFSISALIGFSILFLTLDEFGRFCVEIFKTMNLQWLGMAQVLKGS